MNKLLLSLVLVAFLSGCKTNPPIVKTEYKNVYVPVYVVPGPPEVQEPVLATDTLTEAQKQDIGELAKAYVIENKQLRNFNGLLLEIVQKYAEMASKTGGVWEIVIVNGHAELREKQGSP